MKRVKWLFLIIIFLYEYSSLWAQSPDLDYNHWIYDFVAKMEARGLFQKFDAGMKPYSRNEIGKLLMQIDQKAAEKPDLLSRVERGLLEQFKGEFYDELVEKNIEIQSRYHERHAINWREGENRLYLDFCFREKLNLLAGDQYPESDYPTEMTLGGILRGDLGKNFSFFVDVQNRMRSTEDSLKEQFDPSQGQPVVTTGSHAFSDQAVAYFKWQLPWFTLKFGRDFLCWGPGYRGGLTISQNNPPFDMILLQTRFNRFNFQYFHGFLNSKFENKYLVGHRVELKAANWLYLSGTETVVYGNRGVELQYLNPLMPYHVAEHHLGDKDNNMMSFDISAYPFKNHKYYTEILLDDFTSSENWFTYIGNKFAFLIGGYWVMPFGIDDLDLRLEYSRVEPFVYTHYDSVNNYINYDQIIGYWTGPNSDNLFLETNYWIYKDVHLKFSWERVRRGWGDVYIFPTKGDGTRKYFLKGTVEKQHIWSFQIKDQLFKDVFLLFRTDFIRSKNLGKIANRHSFDKQFRFEVYINY